MLVYNVIEKGHSVNFKYDGMKPDLIRIFYERPHRSKSKTGIEERDRDTAFRYPYRNFYLSQYFAMSNLRDWGKSRQTKTDEHSEACGTELEVVIA